MLKLILVACCAGVGAAFVVPGGSVLLAGSPTLAHSRAGRVQRCAAARMSDLSLFRSPACPLFACDDASLDGGVATHCVWLVVDTVTGTVQARRICSCESPASERMAFTNSPPFFRSSFSALHVFLDLCVCGSGRSQKVSPCFVCVGACACLHDTRVSVYHFCVCVRVCECACVRERVCKCVCECVRERVCV